MKKIYIAGAYSANNVIDVLKNIGRGEQYAAEIFRAGYAPFTPWHDKDFVIKNWTHNFTVKEFYDYSIEWLKVSDGLFIVPNISGLMDWEDSKGTLREIAIADEIGIPIFYSLEDLYNYSF